MGQYKTARRGTLGLIAVLLLATSAAAQSTKSSQGSARLTLPVPPQQNAPWSPPASTLPETIVSATAALFRQGLPDPRSLEYREVELLTGAVWSNEGTVRKAHAWVYPPSGNNPKATRYAIAWNGLVYPLISVGKRIDLAADVDAVTKAHDKARADENAAAVFGPMGAPPEDESVDVSILHPIHVCLLLRLGEASLAERSWKDWNTPAGAPLGIQGEPVNDYYLWIAKDWLWARFNRSICARLRGDDRLSECDARALPEQRKDVEAEARKRGLIHLDEEGKPVEDELGFLDNAPDLLADEQRRLAEPARRSALDAGPQKYPTKATYIAALIADLESVSATQMGQPGGVPLADDPIVQALVKQGDDAVEPLLKCLESDTRLTRSVSFGRDFSYYRQLLGVYEAAYVALCNILQDSFYDVRSTSDDLTGGGAAARAAIAAKIRSFWQKYHGLPLVERWYAILADDHADPERWSGAAANLTQPDDVEISRGSMFGTTWVFTPNRKEAGKVRLRGESLRSKKNPSVSELMVKRLENLESRPVEEFHEQDGEQAHIRSLALSICGALVSWDGRQHLADIRKFSEYLKRCVFRRSPYGNQVLFWVASLYGTRASLGDDKALDEYAAFIRSVDLGSPGADYTDLFDTMWRFPDHPAILSAAGDLFDHPSRYNPLLRAGDPQNWERQQLIQSPLLGVDAFREEIIRMLRDRSEVGQAQWKSKTRLEMSGIDGSYNAGTPNPADPLSPAMGSVRHYRMCDVCAHQLRSIQGMPNIEVWWPQELRDRAVDRCAELLTEYGKALRYDPGLGYLDRAAIFHFPQLDHPATGQDVAGARALFTLAGNSKQTRVWRMPYFPMTGSWKRAGEQPVKPLAGLTTGNIYQAEEVLEEGIWKRYYGFVGYSGLLKLPAEEVEVDVAGNSGFQAMSQQSACSIALPNVVFQPSAKRPLPSIAESFPIIVALGNRRGVGRSLPAVWYERSPKGRPSIHPGVSFKLSYAPQTSTPDCMNFGDIFSGDEHWVELPMKASATWRPDNTERFLETAEAFEIMRFNLQDWFDLKQPGTYRFQVCFDAKSGGFADGHSAVAQFTLGLASTVQGRSR